MKKAKKFFISFIIIIPMLMTISIVKAEILSSSKTLTSSKYSGAYIQAIPQVKCSNTGSFSWLSRTAPEKVHGNLYYSFYSNGNKWSGDAKSKTTTYTWKWYALKLPTGASGGSTQVGSGTKKATFTYNSSTKKLSVQ